MRLVWPQPLDSTCWLATNARIAKGKPNMGKEYDFVPRHREPIALVDGATYANGLDEKKVILGTPYGYPDFCYSSDGDWFDRATGTYVGYDWDTGEMFAKQPPSWRDIHSKVTDEGRDGG